MTTQDDPERVYADLEATLALGLYDYEITVDGLLEPAQELESLVAGMSEAYKDRLRRALTRKMEL